MPCQSGSLWRGTKYAILLLSFIIITYWDMGIFGSAEVKIRCLLVDSERMVGLVWSGFLSNWTWTQLPSNRESGTVMEENEDAISHMIYLVDLALHMCYFTGSDCWTTTLGWCLAGGTQVKCGTPQSCRDSCVANPSCLSVDFDYTDNNCWQHISPQNPWNNGAGCSNYHLHRSCVSTGILATDRKSVV